MGRSVRSFSRFHSQTLTTRRSPRAIVDKEGNHYAELVGRPCDTSYTRVIRGVDEALTNAASILAPFADKKGHRRGLYPSLSVGITHGGGSQVGLHSCSRVIPVLNLPTATTLPEITAMASGSR